MKAQSAMQGCVGTTSPAEPTPFHEVPLADHKQPLDAAHAYESLLKTDVFSKTDGHADVVLLGLGDDGHTASLFPDTDALVESAHLYTATYVPKADMWRLTATIPLLSQAEQLVFLVSGASKAEAVRWLVNPLEGDPSIPARYVADAANSVTLLLDKGRGFVNLMKSEFPFGSGGGDAQGWACEIRRL